MCSACRYRRCENSRQFQFIDGAYFSTLARASSARDAPTLDVGGRRCAREALPRVVGVGRAAVSEPTGKDNLSVCFGRASPEISETWTLGLASVYQECIRPRNWSEFGAGPSWTSASGRFYLRTGLDGVKRVTSIRSREMCFVTHGTARAGYTVHVPQLVGAV